MYLELKPLEALRHTELPQVAAPWYALTWLKNAQSGFCRVGGFNDAWEACIQEIDPRRNHWDHRAHGFERVCAKIKQGDWVVVLDKSWPPLAPAYAEVNGQWQVTQHIGEPGLRRRMESQVQTIQRAQREQEALHSRNQPSSAEAQSETASGPGNRVASLGPHAGATSNSNSDSSKGFPAKDAEADKAFNQALADQRVMLDSKKQELVRWDDNAKENFNTWFGSKNEADRDVIIKRIDATLAVNKGYDISKFKPSSPENKSAYAYVNPSDSSHHINLGDPFWSAPATGTDSKAGILSHEMSHFNDVGKTDDFAYGAMESKQLAINSPEKALYNADSFEYYLENEK